MWCRGFEEEKNLQEIIGAGSQKEIRTDCSSCWFKLLIKKINTVSSEIFIYFMKDKWRDEYNVMKKNYN